MDLIQTIKKAKKTPKPSSALPFFRLKKNFPPKAVMDECDTTRFIAG